ncbi:hypothetical protein [Burkholderia contaminans]|uniref:hypothetical protein n=1 Tax=Burkholderia contaminans TaxID=488447 RepID=UPI0012601D22|nr:hypothetical protein [Burkholderia contaminans]
MHDAAKKLVNDRLQELERDYVHSTGPQSSAALPEGDLRPVASPFDLRDRASKAALDALIGGNAKLRRAVEGSDVAPAARRRLMNIAMMLDVARRSRGSSGAGEKAGKQVGELAKQVGELILRHGLGESSPFCGYAPSNDSNKLAKLEAAVSTLVTKEAFQREVDDIVARVSAAHADYVEARLGAPLPALQRKAIIDNGGIMSERAKSALKLVAQSWNADSGMNRVFLLEILLDAERLQRALSVSMHEPAGHDVTDADGGKYPSRMPRDDASALPAASGPRTEGRYDDIRNGAMSPYRPYNKIVFAPTIKVGCGSASEGRQHAGMDDDETPRAREQETNAVMTGRTVDRATETKADDAAERFDAKSIIERKPERQDARSILTFHRESKSSGDCDTISESHFGSRYDHAYWRDEMDNSAEPNEGSDTKAGANSERDYGFGSNGMSNGVGTRITSADLQRQEAGSQTEPSNPPIAHRRSTIAPTLAATVKLVRSRHEMFGTVSSTPYARLSSGFADPLPPRAGFDLRVGYALKNVGSYLKLMDRGETAEGFGAKRSSFSAPKSPERVRDDGAPNQRVEAEAEHAVSHGSKHGANASQRKEGRQGAPVRPHGEVVGSYLNNGTLNIISTRNTRTVDLFPRKEGGQSAPRLPVNDGYAHKHVGSYLEKKLDKVVTTEGAQSLSKHWRN